MFFYMVIFIQKTPQLFNPKLLVKKSKYFRSNLVDSYENESLLKKKDNEKQKKKRDTKI